MPQNLEAEEATIGGILFAGAPALARVSQGLAADDFYHPALQAVYEAMLALDAQAQPIDLITVSAQMRRDNTLCKLKAYGGEAHLAALSCKVATVENIAYHARLVRDKAQARRIIQAAAAIMDRAYQEGDIGELCLDALGRLTEATARTSEEDIIGIRPLLHAALTRLDERHKTKGVVRGISYGIEHLDELTGGMHPAQMIIIAAETGRGKTSLGLQILAHAGELGVPSLTFSLEMPADDLVDRMICQAGPIDGQRFASGCMETRDFINLTKAASRLSEAPMDFALGTMHTVETVRQVARRWHLRRGCPKRAIILVDYLQLVECAAGRRKGRDPGTREQEVALVSRLLKMLALETGCTVIGLSQVNEQGELRESRAIAQNADVVMILSVEEGQPDDTIECRIKKNRKGPRRSVRLLWSGGSTSFRQHKDQVFQSAQAQQQAGPKAKAKRKARTTG